jgi:hypothetical protein
MCKFKLLREINNHLHGAQSSLRNSRPQLSIIIPKELLQAAKYTVKNVKQFRYRPGVPQRVPGS